MHGFSGVLFEMQAFDPDITAAAVRQINAKRALTNNRLFELADLIALRQIGVKIVFPVKNTDKIDFGLQAKTCPHRLAHTFMVDHRQHSRHRRINKRYILIGIGTERG